MCLIKPIYDFYVQKRIVSSKPLRTFWMVSQFISKGPTMMQ